MEMLTAFKMTSFNSLHILDSRLVCGLPLCQLSYLIKRKYIYVEGRSPNEEHFLEANICLKTLQSEILTAEQDTRPVHTLGSNMCFL